MKNQYLYSATTNAFYHTSLNYPSLPVDVIPIDTVLYDEFSLSKPPHGKIRIPGSNGYPCWGDQVEHEPNYDYSKLASAKKTHCLEQATIQIATLSDAIELGIAKKGDDEKVKEWKKYRVLINQIDLLTAPNIEWPVLPI